MRAGRTDPLCISSTFEEQQLSTTNNAHPTHPHTHQMHISNRRTVVRRSSHLIHPFSLQPKLNYPPASKNNNSSQPTTRAPRTHTYAKRQLAYLVLNNIPFSIPFDVRVSIFRSFVSNDGNTLNPVLNLISLLTPCRCG
ncbi:hypothetical protein L208DRAFT_1400433 [Tricholoma matsutake]|nr:hypothetical protein L208DRAFT_1400433 [Tricholoma matsutake 945]